MALDQQQTTLALASLRLRMGDDIKEFQCAQRMLLRKAVLQDELQWNVIWQGKNVISARLVQRLQRLGGLMGAW
ncbi:hypothetical protein ACIPLR_11125 [Herbaspirillum huttiense]|jgi:hypothetical protein|uniref:Uncharacterized protein n=1 Tax=Herbaspirillum frisingense TaxID=92645 RepID=A0ABU1PCP8_9BURK|nr:MULTISPECIES: hypothetical protein [Herbaspirillum]MDR6583544.1 hypothetical protein [Herbaspirillum frisingense]